MSLSQLITEHLARVGAIPPKSFIKDAVTTLVHEVIWPDLTFAGSPRLLRSHLVRQGEVRVKNWSDDRLRDELPLICGLRFLQPESRGKFWDNWETSFPFVDPRKLFPIASDDYYYYFLAANNADPSNPSLYTLDHEETRTDPYDGRFRTISNLLAVIEAEGNIMQTL